MKERKFDTEAARVFVHHHGFHRVDRVRDSVLLEVVDRRVRSPTSRAHPLCQVQTMPAKIEGSELLRPMVDLLSAIHATA